MRRTLLAAVKMVVVTMLLTGLAYPLTITVLSRVAFPREAGGSLVGEKGRIVGSELVGQRFSSDRYFHGRPSAAGSGYDPLSSGASNLAPSSRVLIARVSALSEDAASSAPSLAGRVPVDLVTASGSGLDPHLSPAAARAQVPRVAKARGMTEASIGRLVDASIEPRQLWVLGEPRVNVLLLNLALDGRR